MFCACTYSCIQRSDRTNVTTRTWRLAAVFGHQMAIEAVSSSSESHTFRRPDRVSMQEFPLLSAIFSLLCNRIPCIINSYINNSSSHSICVYRNVFCKEDYVIINFSFRMRLLTFNHAGRHALYCLVRITHFRLTVHIFGNHRLTLTLM